MSAIANMSDMTFVDLDVFRLNGTVTTNFTASLSPTLSRSTVAVANNV